MTHDERQYRRRSLRLKGYDYTQSGAYFVTIVTQDRECLFGEVVSGTMRLNDLGRIVWEEWFRSAEIRREIHLTPEEFVVMPNHIHGIVWIGDHAQSPGAHDNTPCVGAHGRAPLRCASLRRPPRSLGAFIAGFKSAAAKRINHHRGTPGAIVWQRNYYEHIIRTDEALNRIREYILTNPLRWHLDRENPAAAGRDDVWESLFHRASGHQSHAGGLP